jgi:hypothetical protein
MKRNSTSRSAFFNLRILFALLVGMTGLSLALIAANSPGRSAGPAAAKVAAKNALLRQKYDSKSRSIDISFLPPGFDCAQIHAKGIDKQENFRAGLIMMACGYGQGGKSSPAKAFSHFVRQLLPQPLAYGATDVNLITGTESFPRVTQSETYSLANPDNPDQIVVAYNDSRGAPTNYSGASVSNDGGLTFTRLTTASGQSPFTNTFGDPVVLYSSSTGTWFTVWLDGGCGGQGLGGYKSTTPDDPNSWTHFCIHNNSADDRESGWSDNNPGSPFFGNMYVSWNDFNTGNADIFVSRSTDDGLTWSSPLQVSTGGTFIRNVQITGDLSGNGDVYIAGMDEGGGGFPHNDINYIFKSTDGGATWSNTYGPPASPSFPGPGVTSVGYFACMFNDFGGYWRHEGWGQPAAFNGVVHLTYAQHGAGSDPGDVYYIRSTDGGFTFGTPVKLNTDATTRPQWQPNLSVSPTGTLLATWYDARESANCVAGDPNTPCYRMWSRKSLDNGLSWLPDDTLSDVVTPLPAQPDDLVQPTYAGDYDYGSAVTTKHLTAWADGRVALNSTSQQDAFADRDLVGFAAVNADPACGSFVVGTAPTDFTVNLSEAADPSSVQGSDFTVNGTPADNATLSNGDQTITFGFNTSPVVQGENTMNIAAGAILSASGNDPILEFNCTFRYGQEQLAVVDTDPPVGGTFTGPGTSPLDVNFNIPVDPSSIQDTDLQLSGVSATVTGHTVSPDNMTVTFTINFTSIFSGTLTASIGAGAIADEFGNPNAAFTGNYNYNGNFCPTFTENFDSVTPPTLPPDWLATQGVNAGGFPFWETSDSGSPAPPADSPPNSVYSVDPDNLLDNRVDTPTLTYTAGAQLSFTHNYDLEEADAIVAYDNGLLEMSTDGGTTFQEITAAGGSFVSGGYDHQEISDGFENPCFQQYGTARPNWSGISNGGAGGFQTTTVMLPASGAGQSVKFRWRMCSDNSVPHTGWRVDNVAIFEPCGTPTPTPTPTVTPTPTPGTPTPTPSVTPTPTGTPGHSPTPRPRGTPRPRP